MLAYVSVFGLELLMGALIGFYLTDKKKGFSKKELKIGGIAFLLVNATFLFTADTLNVHDWMQLVMAFAAIFIGIAAGESLHLRLVQKIMGDMLGGDMQRKIEEFVYQVQSMAKNTESGSTAQVNVSLIGIAACLRTLRLRARLLKRTDIIERLDYINEVCIQLSRLSFTLQLSDEASTKRFVELSNELTAVAREVLSDSQFHIEEKLKSSWATIQIAFKLVHMK